MESTPLVELSNTRCVMNSNSIDNRLRLSQALNPYKNSASQTEKQAKGATLSSEPSSTADAVKSTIDSRLKESERTLSSGRTLEQVKDLVRSGQYFAQTATKSIAEALQRDLLGG